MVSALKYRPDIDGLRALAVLGVVIYHVDPAIMPGGFLGVDIFFVISGYLISLIIFREQINAHLGFTEFYGRRVRRLFPALILVLASALGFGYFALLADEYEQLGRHAVSAIVFLLNFRQMSEAGYFDVVSYGKPLLHLWSLSVEEQFYIVWPILFLLFRRLRFDLLRALVLCAFLSFAYALWLGDIAPDQAYYHPLTRFWELLVGAAMAYLHYTKGVNWLPVGWRSPMARNILSASGIALVAGALLGFSKNWQHPGPATLWPLVGAMALIATGPSALINRLLAVRPLVLVGLISYPLYLWHWPILSYIRIMESGHPIQWVLWCGAVLALALAWLTYQWIELPLRMTREKRRVTLYLVCAMGVLLIVAAAIVMQGGLPKRAGLLYFQAQKSQMIREARQDQSCMALFPKNEAPVYCRQHNAGDRMIAIIGDSHAHALFPGVAELAESRGYGTLLLANSGCPPLMGAVVGRTPTEREQCARNIQKIIESLSRNKRVVSVIIASRGPQYLTGMGFGAVEKDYSYPPITTQSSDGSEAFADPIEVFMNGLVVTATHLNNRGMQVSYLLQVPELGVSAQDCLGRPLALFRESGSCTVDYQTYAERMRVYRDSVRSLPAIAPFLHVVNVEQMFCNDTTCSGLMNGQLLYADDNHLSAVGSRKIAPAVLKSALGS